MMKIDQDHFAVHVCLNFQNLIITFGSIYETAVTFILFYFILFNSVVGEFGRALLRENPFSYLLYVVKISTPMD